MLHAVFESCSEAQWPSLSSLQAQVLLFLRDGFPAAVGLIFAGFCPWCNKSIYLSICPSFRVSYEHPAGFSYREMSNKVATYRDISLLGDPSFSFDLEVPTVPAAPASCSDQTLRIIIQSSNNVHLIFLPTTREPRGSATFVVSPQLCCWTKSNDELILLHWRISPKLTMRSTIPCYA